MKTTNTQNSVVLRSLLFVRVYIFHRRIVFINHPVVSNLIERHYSKKVIVHSFTKHRNLIIQQKKT